MKKKLNMKNWITVTKDELKTSYEGKAAIYRWKVANSDGEIVEGYVGETTNVKLRYHDYTRYYKNEQEKNYPGDFFISRRIEELKEFGFKIEFQILKFDEINGVTPQDIIPQMINCKESKLARRVIERVELENYIKKGVHLWNSLN